MLGHRKGEGYWRPKPPVPHSLTAPPLRSEAAGQHRHHVVDRRSLHRTHDGRGLHVGEHRVAADLLDGCPVVREQLELRLDHQGLELQELELLSLVFLVPHSGHEEGIGVAVLQPQKVPEDGVIVAVHDGAVELDVRTLVGDGHRDRACFEDVAEEPDDVHVAVCLGHGNSFAGRRWAVRLTRASSYYYNTIICE